MATIESKDTGVEVKVDLKGLPPGVHAVHFHQKAQCDPPDFKSAGGHFNPTSKQHGFDNPQGFHMGDLLRMDLATESNIAKLSEIGKAMGELVKPEHLG